ncbi:MAG: FkbM family methyltransferase [Ignavibacteria bacterium]
MISTKLNNFNRMMSVFKPKSALKYYNLKYVKGDDTNTHYLTLKNGLKLSVNKSAGDLTTLFEIFVNDDYSFKAEKNRKINILDIGANVGYFSLFAAKKFPNADIYSFEPFPGTFERLSDNIRNNNSGIKAFPYAVSDFNGTSDFYSFEWAGCNTMVDREFDEGHYQKTTVNCLAFDDIFTKTGVNEFEFGKIDCEGSEYPIFLNSKDESIRRIKNYILEVHDDKKYTKQDLINRFKALGYDVVDKESLIEASIKE